MIETELVFQFEVVAFDAPTQLRQAHELGQRRIGRQRGQPELGGCRFVARPFDEEPLFGTGRMTVHRGMGGADPSASESGVHGAAGPLPPGAAAPGAAGQLDRELSDGDRSVTGAAAHARRRTAHTATPTRRQRGLARRPDRRLAREDRKSTRLNSSHGYISYAVFCLKKKKKLSIGLQSVQ